MTRSSDFKRAVRARMAKTGERYTTARAHVLARLIKEAGGTKSGDPSGYPYRPGVCRDTGALSNWLAAQGVVSPHSGEPLSEALLTGLAGGVGFLYIVFEYKDIPPTLSVLARYDTAAERFALAGLEKLGLDCRSIETTSATKARKELDSALDAGKPVLCVVDSVAIAQSPAPQMMVGMAPTVVTVVATEGDDLLIDVGAAEPTRISREAFDKARSAFKKGKHRMVILDEPSKPKDLVASIHRAIAECADRYTNAPYKGYASNFGLAGLEKWARLLVDERDKKGWPTLFPEGHQACFALRRTYQGIHHEMTPPSAGRGMYADFLREALEITEHSPYARAAEAFDQAAATWDAIGETITSCGVDAVQSGCEMLDTYAELLDTQATDAQRAKVATQLGQSAESGKLDKKAALELYAQLASQVEAVLQAERVALGALTDALAVLS